MAERESLKDKTYCGDINEKFIGKKISVSGWIQVKRELGGITFIPALIGLFGYAQVFRNIEKMV